MDRGRAYIQDVVLAASSPGASLHTTEYRSADRPRRSARCCAPRARSDRSDGRRESECL